MSNAKKKLLMLLILIIGCIITSLISKLTEDKTVVLKPASQRLDEKLNSGTKAVNVKPKKKLIKIYVSGAVLLPGIYEVPNDARAHQAIQAAGGMLEIADQDKVNLAKLLKDGMQINVPYQKGKRIKVAGTNVEIEAKSLSSNVYREKQKEKTVTFPININTATQQELEKVPGIGPTMAIRIISHRSSLTFRKIDDLLRVQGIGKAKLEKMRPYLCVN